MVECIECDIDIIVIFSMIFEIFMEGVFGVNGQLINMVLVVDVFGNL